MGQRRDWIAVGGARVPLSVVCLGTDKGSWALAESDGTRGRQAWGTGGVVGRCPQGAMVEPAARPVCFSGSQRSGLNCILPPSSRVEVLAPKTVTSFGNKFLAGVVS